MIVPILLLLTGLLPAAPRSVLGLEAIALAGEWDRALEVAIRRQAQLPLRPEEALIAAHAAEVTGDTATRVHFLESAVASPDLGAVARVELAGLVVEEDPDRALILVMDDLRRAPTPEIGDEALELARRAVEEGAGPVSRTELERRMSGISRTRRRGLELALALTEKPVDRGRLSRLLASSTRDLVALEAAEGLTAGGELGALDRWRVAQSFFTHGHFDRAAPIFESLDEVSHPQVPRREVAYFRGRCAFRRGEWSLAAAWYGRAISRSAAGERRAELEVHLARTHELAGDLDQAVAAAQRAVRLRVTDDRRLFLARLRLRRNEPDLARSGLSRLRSRTNQARGELMLGLYALRTGDEAAARRHLARVSRDPWRGPAAVFAARLAAASGDAADAMSLVSDNASGLDDYWAGEARSVVVGLPQEVLTQWRSSRSADFEDSSEKIRQRAMGGAVKLETDPRELARVRTRMCDDLGLVEVPEIPDFRRSIASRLWAIGLKTQALRWDPGGMPRETASSTWWTAEAELELGQPWLAISAADTARWQASSELPGRGLPPGLRRALYPLPHRETVLQAAMRHGVPWTLLAGVSREESRWDPMVVSKVGARGLMQLMPATAAATATANRRPEIDPDDLFEPFISLDLGAAELGRLLEVFDGNRAAAVAAYNAGEAQAKLWLDQCGDRCSESRYIAGISFSVTRGYTEAVLASAAAYDELYPAEVTARTE